MCCLFGDSFSSFLYQIYVKGLVYKFSSPYFLEIIGRF